MVTLLSVMGDADREDDDAGGDDCGIQAAVEGDGDARVRKQPHVEVTGALEKRAAIAPSATVDGVVRPAWMVTVATVVECGPATHGRFDRTSMFERCASGQCRTRPV